LCIVLQVAAQYHYKNAVAMKTDSQAAAAKDATFGLGKGV